MIPRLLAALCVLVLVGCVAEIPKATARKNLLDLPQNKLFNPLQSVDVHYEATDPRSGSRIRHSVSANYFRTGKGKSDRFPVLLLHGTPSSLFTWSKVIFGSGDVRGLSADFDVIAVDLPGHGLTDASLPNSWEAMCAFTRAFLKAIDVPRVSIVGNSYGGEVAWRLAASEPPIVDRLVLICSSGYTRTPAERKGFDDLLVGPFGPFCIAFTYRHFVRGGLKEVFANAGEISDDLVEEKFNVLHAVGNRLTTIDMSRAEGNDAATLACRVTCPTLLLWGTEDHKYTVATQAKQFERDIVGSSLVTIPGCGHTPQYECPAETIRHLRGFLAPDGRSK